MTKHAFLTFLLAAATAAIPGTAARADIVKDLNEAVPRVLLVGDSWTGFMQGYKTFDTYMGQVPEFSTYRQVGYRTAVMGARASDYKTASYLQRVTEELEQNPTIDLVVMTLGGNDLVFSGGPEPDMNDEEINAILDRIVSDVSVVVDHVLALRPDIRIAFVGYTYVNVMEFGATIPLQNEILRRFELRRRQMAEARDRVIYAHNLGLMQYTYGIPLADPPIPPMIVPYPGGYPEYDPFPGGNTDYNAPLEALADNAIHLTQEGYQIVAEKAFTEFINDWLDAPRVYEIVAMNVSRAPAEYRVTFSEPVTGVDTSDFQVSGGAPVDSVSGSGAIYTVTLGAGAKGVPMLELIDDDTIVDADLNPLGGAGPGNGDFSHNGPFAYMPLEAPAEGDFDAVIEFFGIVAEPYGEILGDITFDPEVSDLNGGVANIDPIAVNGNGMVDTYEFAVLRAVLEDDALDLSATGGVTHAQTLAAWQNNLAEININLGGETGLVQFILPGINSYLAGLALIGDQQSAALPTLLLTALGAVDEFPPEITGVTIPNLNDYILLPQFFAFNGDADGDGFTNKQEYDYFAFQKTRADYVEAALNPNLTPPGEGEGEGEGEGAVEGEGGSEGEGEGEGEGGSQLYDFCGVMDATVTTAQSEAFESILALLGDDAALLTLLECDSADLNGPFVDTDNPPDGDADLPGPNGILDGRFELAVVAELLNNPDPYLDLPTGTLQGQVAAGVDPAAVRTAFDANFAALFTPIEALVPVLPALVSALAGIELTEAQIAEINELLPNIAEVLTTYSVLGDPDSLEVVLFLSVTIGDIIAGMPDSPEDFITLNAILGPDGDADGDGFTNREEYRAFAGPSKNATDYIAAVLDPAIAPEAEGEAFPKPHTADTNGNYDIELSELLRVVQLFNVGAYHCAFGQEDGYAPGTGPVDCSPHAADYLPGGTWLIEFPELLRVVQIYNSQVYSPCEGTEDGFCPGVLF